MTGFTGLSSQSRIGTLQLQLATFSTTISNQVNTLQNSLTTGTLIVTGTSQLLGSTLMNDVGITGSLIAGSLVEFTSTTDSISPTTGALVVTGGVGIGKSLFVGGLATFQGGISASGSISGPGVSVSTIATNTITIAGAGVGNTALTINGTNATIDKLGNITGIGTLMITGLSSLNGGINVNGNFSTDTSGNTTIGGTLGVTGLSTLTGGAKLTGNLTLNSGNFTLTQSNGNVSTNGTLTVNSTSFLNGGLSTSAGNLSLSSVGGSITFNSKNVINAVIDDTTNTVAANKLFNGSTWKVTVGGIAPAGGQVLTAGGATTASWITPTGNVAGPGSSTTNAIATFADGTGQLLANTGITIDGNNNIGMSNSTSTANNIQKGGSQFIHNVGTRNTAIGVNAVNLSLTGTDNTGIGTNALKNVSSGSFNTAVGSGACLAMTIASGNTGIGYNALTLSTGSNNVAVGSGSMTNVGTGIDNTAVGYQAMASGSNTSSNVAIGYQALKVTTGGANTAVGYSALSALGSGTSNVAVGNNAGTSYTGGESNNILIGNGVTGTVGESNVTRIGSGQTKFFVAGVRGVTTGNADAVNVLIDSAGQLGTVSSSIKYKENIVDMADKTNNLMKLRPVTFTYKEDTSKKIQYGLIAEEVNEIYPELVVNDDKGDIYSVQYHTLIPMLLNEIQKHDKLIKKHDEQIIALKKKIGV